MRVRILDEARRELADARRRYARVASVKIAARFLAEFRRVADLIGRDPMRWPEIAPDVRRIRFFDHFPYSLVYVVRDDVVIVVAVMHQRRAPGYWRPRTGS